MTAFESNFYIIIYDHYWKKFEIFASTFIIVSTFFMANPPYKLLIIMNKNIILC